MASLSTQTPNPHKHLNKPPGKPISASQALERVQAYLSASETSPHLHPDALFTESGIQYAGSALTGGVVLHQLRRVEAGLKGVWLGIESEGDDTKLDEIIAADAARKGKPPSQKRKLHSERRSSEPLDAVDGPSGNYQQQLSELGEGDVEGELDERNNAGENLEEVPDVQATSNSRKRGREESDAGEGLSNIDKAARKKAKKERRKAEKQARNHQTPSQDTDSQLVNGVGEDYSQLNDLSQTITEPSQTQNTQEEQSQMSPPASSLKSKSKTTRKVNGVRFSSPIATFSEVQRSTAAAENDDSPQTKAGLEDKRSSISLSSQLKAVVNGEESKGDQETHPMKEKKKKREKNASQEDPIDPAISDSQTSQTTENNEVATQQALESPKVGKDLSNEQEHDTTEDEEEAKKKRKAERKALRKEEKRRKREEQRTQETSEPEPESEEPTVAVAEKSPSPAPVIAEEIQIQNTEDSTQENVPSQEETLVAPDDTEAKAKRKAEKKARKEEKKRKKEESARLQEMPSSQQTETSTPAIVEEPTPSEQTENSTPTIVEPPTSSQQTETSTPTIVETPTSSQLTEDSSPAIVEKPTSLEPAKKDLDNERAKPEAAVIGPKADAKQDVRESEESPEAKAQRKAEKKARKEEKRRKKAELQQEKASQDVDMEDPAPTVVEKLQEQASQDVEMEDLAPTVVEGSPSPPPQVNGKTNNSFDTEKSSQEAMVVDQQDRDAEDGDEVATKAKLKAEKRARKEEKRRLKAARREGTASEETPQAPERPEEPMPQTDAQFSSLPKSDGETKDPDLPNGTATTKITPDVQEQEPDDASGDVQAKAEAKAKRKAEKKAKKEEKRRQEEEKRAATASQGTDVAEEEDEPAPQPTAKSPSPAPNTNGNTDDFVPVEKELPNVEAVVAETRDEGEEDAEEDIEAEAKAKRKAEKRARKEEKRQRKEEKRKNQAQMSN